MTTKRAKVTCGEAILNALGARGDLSAQDLVDVTGFTYQGIGAVLRDMREMRAKRVYISGWRKLDHCHTIALYSAGNAEDVPKPVRIDKNAWNRAYRRRKRLGESANKKGELPLALRRELERPAFRHPQDVALFGAKEATAQKSAIGRLYLQSMEVEELEAA